MRVPSVERVTQSPTFARHEGEGMLHLHGILTLFTSARTISSLHPACCDGLLVHSAGDKTECGWTSAARASCSHSALHRKRHHVREQQWPAGRPFHLPWQEGLSSDAVQSACWR